MFAIFCMKMCRLLKKSDCPFVQTKMYLHESPFFKNSLAGASGLVLMSVPECEHISFTVQVSFAYPLGD